MKQNRQHRHSIFCLLPPHVLDKIIQNGTPQQRERALKTKSVDNTFRALRLATQQARFAPQRLKGAMDVATVAQKARTIYTANQTENLPGTVVRTEGQGPTGDISVNEAYDGLGMTFDLLEQAYGRNSIDDEGMPLNATVHFGQAYNNAFWNSEQMVFGDGDGQIFNRFTAAIDVIGHELAHGVTEDEAQLIYFRQSGALNESISDVFGSLVKQYSMKQSASQADWLIGAGLFTSNVNGVALRSMKAPGTAYNDPLLGTDPQPAHMDDYVSTFADNGGVHINSGIPNHAFYQAAIGIGGYAWEKTGRIWYDALRNASVRPNTGFRRFARVTVDVAGSLYGSGSSEQQAVRNGWNTVGISV